MPGAAKPPPRTGTIKKANPCWFPLPVQGVPPISRSRCQPWKYQLSPDMTVTGPKAAGCCVKVEGYLNASRGTSSVVRNIEFCAGSRIAAASKNVGRPVG